jgi:hypothetical protein
VGLAYFNGFDTLAVGFADLGVGVVDLSIPNPGVVLSGEILSVVDTPGEVTKLAVLGDYIYAADGYAGLAIVDAGNPTNLEVVYSWKTEGLDYCEGIAVNDDFLVLMDKYDGVYILSMANPTIPEYLGQFEIREPTSIQFDGEYLMITSKYEGLTVLELLYP